VLHLGPLRIGKYVRGQQVLLVRGQRTLAPPAVLVAHQSAHQLLVKQVEEAVTEEEDEKDEGEKGGGKLGSLPQPADWPHAAPKGCRQPLILAAWRYIPITPENTSRWIENSLLGMEQVKTVQY